MMMMITNIKTNNYEQDDDNKNNYVDAITYIDTCMHAFIQMYSSNTQDNVNTIINNKNNKNNNNKTIRYLGSLTLGF